MAKQERVRIAFDFPSRKKAIEWFNGLKHVNAIPQTSAAFETCALDYKKDTGITPSNTYVVKSQNDRDDSSRLKEVVVVGEKVIRA
jgi:hypothetical protein